MACKYVLKSSSDNNLTWEFELPGLIEKEPSEEELISLKEVLTRVADTDSLLLIATKIKSLQPENTAPVIDEANKESVFDLFIKILKPLNIGVVVCTSDEEWQEYGFDPNDKTAVQFESNPFTTSKGKTVNIEQSTIFINSKRASLSDPVHELMHIILETGRASHKKGFERVIQTILNADPIVIANIRAELKGNPRYDSLPKEAKDEEVVVRYLQEYLDTGEMPTNVMDKIIDNTTDVSCGSLLEQFAKEAFGIKSFNHSNILEFLQSPIKQLSRQGSVMLTMRSDSAKTFEAIQKSRRDIRANVIIDNLLGDMSSGINPDFNVDVMVDGKLIKKRILEQTENCK